MAADEKRAVAQADLDALVAACERLYDGLGFDATEWNRALKAVSHAAPLEQVGCILPEQHPPMAWPHRGSPRCKRCVPVYRLAASGRVTEGKGTP